MRASISIDQRPGGWMGVRSLSYMTMDVYDVALEIIFVYPETPDTPRISRLLSFSSYI